MLTIPATAVYVDPSVYTRENSRVRLERMLPHIQCDNIREYDNAAREEMAKIGQRRHGKDDFGDDAVLVFTTFEPERQWAYYHFRDGPYAMEGRDGYCQSALELNSVWGCVFRCAYCGFGRSIHFSLDVERLINGLDDVFARYPEQRLYKYSNMTDLPPFEPELDAVAPMVRRFAQESDRYLMLFTKSDNIDFLLGLEHGGQTIISWSISCDTASRAVDKRAPTMGERIDAMRKAQAAGYRVRARLSPIVPVRNWRQEYEDLFDEMFAKARPDIITLELLGWFGYEDLAKLVPLDMLDPEPTAAAEAAAEELSSVGWGPFTEDFYQEVYRFCIEAVRRHSATTPVSVCHGTQATWDALGGLMGMTPDNYICNCGPTSAPGNPIYDAANAGRQSWGTPG